MLLKLDNPKLFTDVVSIISELVTEVKINVGEEGLKIIAVDPANVALVSFLLPKTTFSQYEVGNNETLGVSLDSLKSILKRSSSSSSLVMQSKENTLKVEIHDKIKREFNISLINIEKEDKEMPDLEFECKVEMKSSDFSKAIEDCSVVADSCSFAIKDGNFIVEAKGLHSAKSEFSGDEANVDGKGGRAKYSLEYLEKIIKSSKLAGKVGINFSDDYPLKLEYLEDKFGLAFVLAPRVETED